MTTFSHVGSIQPFAATSRDLQEVALGAPQAALEFVRGAAKTSTQRGREFRIRHRGLATRTAGRILSAMAQLALQVIHHLRSPSYHVRVNDEALIFEAMRLCPCRERLNELLDRGKLPQDVAQSWLAVLAENENTEPASPGFSLTP